MPIRGRVFNEGSAFAPALVAGLLVAALSECGAQALPAPDRMPESRPALPGFQAPARPSLVLPPLPPVPDDGQLSGQIKVFVRRIEVQGHTVLSAAALRELLAPYEGREVSAGELQELRRRLTLQYVERGYISSGALLPDQPVRDGVIRFQVVEGELGGIDVATVGRLDPGYVAERIRLGTGAPLNLTQLQERLRILQQDRLIESINAELRPGAAPGESRLAVEVKEAQAFEAGVGINNQRSPSVGANRFEAYAAHRNLGGRGDVLEARYGFTSGLKDYALAYALPLNAGDTQIALRASASDALVVESPFRPLDIRSKASTQAVALTQPLLRTATDRLGLGVSFERRSSDTTLLGQPFSFAPGIPDGRSRSGAWRYSLEWLHRTPDEVLALRVALLDGSTNAGPKVGGAGPDPTFKVVQLQLQWARRVSRAGGQVLARLDAQETSHALMAQDRLGMGGAGSVRGYRENLLLRDRGQIVSLEYRHPLVSSDLGGDELQAAVFYDRGRGTNRDPAPALPQSISSVGGGILWNPWRSVQLQLHYGRALRTVATPTRDSADRGVHFSLTYQFF